MMSSYSHVFASDWGLVGSFPYLQDEAHSLLKVYLFLFVVDALIPYDTPFPD